MSRGTGTLPASPPPLLSALPSLGAADLLHCINLQVEGKTRQMKKTARQYLLLTYVCDLAKSMPGRDARDAIRPLFRKMATSDESREAFNDHLAKYIAHVKTRAEVKKKEMEEEEEGEGESEYVALKKGEQVGPGGLDPAEVFETLPKELQEAFGERSIEALKQCLSKMSTEDATYHMKRCTDSGLWNPAGGGDDDGEAPGESPPHHHRRRPARPAPAPARRCPSATRRSCATDAGQPLVPSFTPAPSQSLRVHPPRSTTTSSVLRGDKVCPHAHACVQGRDRSELDIMRSPHGGLGRVHILLRELFLGS